MEFSQYKSNAMKKLEYALSEGLVDEGVISVINSFNSHPDIFTTSSCAGRIQLIILPDIGRKDSVQRRKTWHREVTVDDVDLTPVAQKEEIFFAHKDAYYQSIADAKEEFYLNSLNFYKRYF